MYLRHRIKIPLKRELLIFFKKSMLEKSSTSKIWFRLYMSGMRTIGFFYYRFFWTFLLCK